MKNKKGIIIGISLLLLGGLGALAIFKGEEILDKSKDEKSVVEEDKNEEEDEYSDVSDEKKYLMIASKTIASSDVGKNEGVVEGKSIKIDVPIYPMKHTGTISNNSTKLTAEVYNEGQGKNVTREGVLTLEDYMNRTIDSKNFGDEKYVAEAYITNVINEDECDYDNLILECNNYKVEEHLSQSSKDYDSLNGNNHRAGAFGTKYNVIYKFNEDDELLSIDVKQVTLVMEDLTFNSDPANALEYEDLVKIIDTNLKKDDKAVERISENELKKFLDEFYGEYYYSEEHVTYER